MNLFIILTDSEIRVPPHVLAVRFFPDQGLMTASCTVIDPCVAFGAFMKVVFGV